MSIDIINQSIEPMIVIIRFNVSISWYDLEPWIERSIQCEMPGKLVSIIHANVDEPSLV